jgi:CTP:phosphocholine cytidylyltransferase-like protein
MKIIFLCGKIGRRMSPLTEAIFLSQFLGKPLFEHQIPVADEAGIIAHQSD